MRTRLLSSKDYISCISHELKAPLNVITGSSQIARMYINDEAKVQQCLDRINVAGSHLTELIDNLMTLVAFDGEWDVLSDGPSDGSTHEHSSTQNYGQCPGSEDTPAHGSVLVSESQLTPFNINELLDELMIMIQPSAVNHKVDVIVDTSMVTDFNVRGHYRHLLQILINVTGNAIKYSPAGEKAELKVMQISSGKGMCSCETDSKVTLSGESASLPGLSATLSDETADFPNHASYSQNLYRFVCKDYGMGMPPEFLANIFEPFMRSDVAVSSGIKGTGIGMFIVKRLVDSMKGSIEVTSLEGKGTTVIIEVSM